MFERLRRFYDTSTKQWNHFRESAVGRRVLVGARWLFVGGILAYLTSQITAIGWAKVWASCPTTPWFYVLLLLMYAVLPSTEAVLYGKIWSARHRDLVLALLRKRVLNNEVLGYSGEAYFCVWAQRETNLTPGEALRTIKDNTIISSVVSTGVAFSLLALFVLTGQIELLEQFLPVDSSVGVAGAAVFILALIVGVNIRRVVFFLPAWLLGLLGAGHLVRFVLNYTLQVAQWAIVIPEVPLDIWITLLALHIVIHRVPFVPSRGLVFMSAGVGLSGTLQIPEAALGSMLLAQTLLDRVLNLLTYAGTSVLDAATVDDHEELKDLSLPDELA
ncbi:MAG: hypothetical protein BRD31_05870 [Bacteroidetes bacterium QH_2_64_26]|nr:MAG: hypothetical protein BRD31_05870 [Bacteroidetes bacterium QH_2_64_26]